MERKKLNYKAPLKNESSIGLDTIRMIETLLEGIKNYSFVASELQRLIKEGEPSLILKQNKNK